MEKLIKILSELNFQPESLTDDVLENTRIFKFITKKLRTKKRSLLVYKDFRVLAAKSISCALYYEDKHWFAEVDVETIQDLLQNREDDEYKFIFEFLFGKIKYLESQNNNNVRQMVGENFNIEYNLFIKILASSLTDFLNLQIEKVKMELFLAIKPREWYLLFLGNNFPTDEEERIDKIVKWVFCT